MELEALLKDVPILASRLTDGGQIHGITSDSRTVREGDMLICLRGTRQDGHRYIADGIRRGARLIVAESAEGIPEGMDYVLTPDTRLAEAMVWNNRYHRPAEGMKRIGITGSNGKTSTAYMLRDLLAAGGYTVGMSTTVSVTAGEESLTIPDGGSTLTGEAGAMTTPDPAYFYGAIAQMRDKGCDVLLYEASSHSLAQRKTEPIRPDLAIFTNLTPEHMDYHGSMEDYLAAKAKLFRHARLGICQAGDPWSHRLRQLVPNCPFLTCMVGAGEEAIKSDAAAMRIRQSGGNTSFLYCGRDAIFRVRMPHMGRFTLWNATMAICAALHMQVEPMTIRRAMETLRLPKGRLEKLKLGDDVPFSVYIDYAHTPAALEQVLTTARDFGEKLTVLFGCGGDRDRTKRPVMGEIAERLADKVVLTSDNTRGEEPEAILAEILSGMDNPTKAIVIPDRREAIRQAIREASPGETILLCGKGHEGWEIVGKTKYPFDERSIVREALPESGGTHR